MNALENVSIDLRKAITPEIEAAWHNNALTAIGNALKRFAPPEKLTISEWADKYRFLGNDESSFSGQWDTDNTPYLREIMDCFCDETTEQINFIKPTQVGATECGINICAYTIASDPCRLLYIMPDDDLAKDFSVDRLQKAFKNSPAVAEKFNATERTKAKVIRFPGGFLRLEGAQSPAKLASWSIPKVIMDEVDKYPAWAGREASPIELVKERTKNWSWRKILSMSTPTTEAGNIYQAYINSDVRYKYHVPCPHCGEYQTLDFGNIKFTRPKSGPVEPTIVAKTAYYQCSSCGEKILDKHKKEMLAKGKWVAENQFKGKPLSKGFALNSLYSPWVTFSQMVEKFLSVKDDPAQLMNFVNSWLGEPWRSKASRIEVDSVLNQRTELSAGYVPKWAKTLTAGVDCQQGYFVWSVRAWGIGLTSQKIANGTAATWGDLERIMDTQWKIEGSWETMQISLYAIDAGYNSDEVYAYCYEHMDIAVPVKGSSHPMEAFFKYTPVQPRNGRQRPMNLVLVNTNHYKDFIVARMNKEPGVKGSWQVDADTTREYAEQICSEHKIVEQQGRTPIEKWVKISSARQNHYLDTEVYNAVCADILNVSLWTEESFQAEIEESSGSGFGIGSYRM